MAGDWKKSKGLTFILLIVIVVGGYLFVSGGDDPNILGVIKDTFICTECGFTKEVKPFDFREDGFPPYVCDSCGAKAMWKAYDCSKCKDEDGNDLVFAGTTEIEAPEKMPDEDSTPEEISQYNKYLGSLMGTRCPKCGAAAGGFIVTQHYGPEAQAERQRQDDEFRRRSK